MNFKKFSRPFEFIQKETTSYRKIDFTGIETKEFEGQEFLLVPDEGIEKLTYEAFRDLSFLLRKSHLCSLEKIIKDDNASDNDKFSALELLENAKISSEFVLPMCQDTGTAIVSADKGDRVLTKKDDRETITKAIYNVYQDYNLRYSQNTPISMYEEKNTKNNLPAQIDIYSKKGGEYNFLFMAKGGGSANKTFLFQETKALLEEEKLIAFIKEKISLIGTSACPPYHLAIVVGGTSAENNLKTLKLASAKYLDDIDIKGGEYGQGFRCPDLEEKILKITKDSGVGAQFGGKYFCHDVRVIRLPRHGASLPVSIGVSCSADRQIKAKINKDGLFLERLEQSPAENISFDKKNKKEIEIDLSKPMEETRNILSQYPVGTRVLLNGKIIVARDIAHSKINKILQEKGELPSYFKDYPIYYAGPAKKPENMPSGSFGPTTASRMDPYVDDFQKNGGSFVMIAKGNRGKEVVKACKENKGFYLGCIGGVAAKLAKDYIKEIKLVEFEELGMEAVWQIRVENLPCFIVIDDKGNDFYS